MLQERIITQKQLEKTVYYQKENPEFRIGEALVELGFADMKAIVKVLAKQKPQEEEGENLAKEISPKLRQAMKLGEILLKEKIISLEQLEETVYYQKENPEFRFGEALVELGLVDMKTIVGTLAKQNPQEAESETLANDTSPKLRQAMKLGEILLKEKVISPDQFRKALQHQHQNQETLFGKVLIDLGFTSEETILSALAKQKEPSEKVSVPPEQGKMMVKLGEILLGENVITEKELRQALEYQKEYSGTMFGQALVNLGFVSKRTISESLRKVRQET